MQTNPQHSTISTVISRVYIIDIRDTTQVLAHLFISSRPAGGGILVNMIGQADQSSLTGKSQTGDVTSRSQVSYHTQRDTLIPLYLHLPRLLVTFTKYRALVVATTVIL